MKYKITALKVQRRNSDRVNIYLDDSFAFGVNRIVAAWLRIGQELCDEEIISLKNTESFETAFQKALIFLDYRPRSEKEVRDRLTEKGFQTEVIDDVIERLLQGGLIGDEQFAKTWIENRIAFRPRSHKVLAIELRQKGISEDVVEEMLSETINDDEIAYQAAIKQARRYSGCEWKDFRNRLTGYLARKGFTYATIQPLVERVWTEQNDSNQIKNYHQDEEYDNVYSK